MYAAQSEFYKTMTAQYKQVFGEQQAILDALTKEFEPILARGPEQTGFSAEEEAGYRSQAREGTAQSYAKAAEALEEGEAARGGGNIVVPSGAAEQRRADLAARAAGAESQMQLGITEKNYAVGRENYNRAAAGLGQVAAEQNPIGFAGATTGAGGAASKTASDISAADNSVMSAAFGALGGIGGAALGNLNVGPFGGGE